MDYTEPVNPLDPSVFVGSGLIGLAIAIVLAIVGFVVSAFVMSVWIRLIITFMRRTLDREYGRMRTASLGFQADSSRISPVTGKPVPLRGSEGPRDW